MEEKPKKTDFTSVQVRIPLHGKREATLIRYYLALEEYYYYNNVLEKNVQWSDILSKYNIPTYPLLSPGYDCIDLTRACDAYNLMSNACAEVQDYISARVNYRQEKVISLTDCSNYELYAELGRRSFNHSLK